MEQRQQRPLAEPTDRWQDRFCSSSWCRGGRWLVRADPRAAALWQVAESEDQAPWAVAADDPICPLCGELLAEHVEGVGEPEIAIDNPFVGFIRTLKTAA
jgi:ribosomal protein S27AE